LSIFLPLADALAVVHGKGILHRDLKPANILAGVPERGAVLTDFGLTWTEGQQALTAVGNAVGTVRYMAPELLRGEPPNALADLYGLGATMFELATGHRPFEGRHGSTLMLACLDEKLPPVRDVTPAVPDTLAVVIDRAVQTLATERFPSARSLHRALVEAGRSLEPEAWLSAEARPAARPSSRKLVAPVPASASQPARFRFSTWPASWKAALALSAVLWVGFVLILALNFRRAAAPPEPGLGTAPSVVEVDSLPSTGPDSGPASGQPVRLTASGETVSRVALAALEGRLLAAWVRTDGRVGVTLSQDGGRTWLRAPVDGQLRACTDSDLHLRACAGRFHILYGAPKDGKELWAFAAWTSGDARTWSASVGLGPITSDSRLSLVADPPGSKQTRLLAGWTRSPKAWLTLAWGSAQAGTWSAPLSPPGATGRSRFAAVLTARSGGLAIWQIRNREMDVDSLQMSRSYGPRSPWTPAAPLEFETGGESAASPVAASDGERVWLLWERRDFLATRRMLAFSADGGGAFRAIGPIPMSNNKDTRCLLAARGDRLWTVWNLGLPSRLAWSFSRDRGGHWSIPGMLSRLGDSAPSPAIALTTAGEPWVLYADESSTAQIVRLP
jgi:hypothetical protein